METDEAQVAGVAGAGTASRARVVGVRSGNGWAPAVLQCPRRVPVVRRYEFWILLLAVGLAAVLWMLLESSGNCACTRFTHKAVVVTTPGG